jgi:hypothetical protein
VFVPVRPFELGVMFASKGGADLGSTFQVVSSRVGSGLTCKHYTMLEMPAGDQQSSLFCQAVSYEEKKFCESGS